MHSVSASDIGTVNVGFDQKDIFFLKFHAFYHPMFWRSLKYLTFLFTQENAVGREPGRKVGYNFISENFSETFISLESFKVVRKGDHH